MFNLKASLLHTLYVSHSVTASELVWIIRTLKMIIVSTKWKLPEIEHVLSAISSTEVTTN